MSTHDSTEIFEQTTSVMQSAIHTVQEVINQAEEDPFKMLLIDSCETLKEPFIVSNCI